MHLLAEFESVVDQWVEEDNNLDIFEMTTNTIDLTMELFNKELLIFKCYQVDIKDFICPIQWWKKHESVSYNWCWCYTNHKDSWILNRNKEALSLVGILASFRRCSLQSKNLNEMIFVNKNQPNDLEISCKTPKPFCSTH